MSPEDFAASAQGNPNPATDPNEGMPAAPAEADLPKAIAVTPEQALAMMAKAPSAAEQPQSPPSPKPEAKSEPQPAAPPTPTRPQSANITVTHEDASPELKPQAASLLDLAVLDAQGIGADGAAKGLRFDEIDSAIIDGFKKNWLPPDATKLSPDQRMAKLQVAINREGRVVSFKVLQSSGSEALDSSVQKAADKLHKIDRALPPGYPGERYEVQIHFHVE
jgi:protein TonB